ncbi:mechanosensitive ion channel family protein [Natronococcus occultus]|uniref:Small-conductance mechanosensitive channel n=1 Tax=Natronococcus occultus SP4 TaxID=694430 RepID=L0K2R1_9EURY|nr:mechanosensitive ion channel family protein [Natronococcus occultus]AGB38820.1 small-conductance mechanosensitive channel [Natronococcus occultus SP4]
MHDPLLARPPWLASLDSGVLAVALPEWEWFVLSLVLLTTYLLSRLVHWGGRWYLHRSATDESTSLRRAIATESYTPLSLSILFIGSSLVLQAFGLIASRSLLSNVVLTALAVVWARAAIRIGEQWLEVANEREQRYEFAPILQNFWTIAVVGVGVLVVVEVWNLQVTPFLASAGVLGVVVGFAAQDAIRNLIGGISLSFDHTYHPGDVVLLEDDTRGTVTDIGIRSTTVLTPDNTMVTVPNAVLNSTQVVNQSAPQRHIRIDVPVSVAYGTDYETVERIASTVCEDAPMVRDSPRPRVLFSEFGDSTLLFEVQVYIAHPLTEKRAIDQLNRRIYDRFAAEGITIPFPQRELSFLEHQEESSRQSASQAEDRVSSRNTPPE